MIVCTRTSAWPSLRCVLLSRADTAPARWPARRAIRSARRALAARLRPSAARGSRWRAVGCRHVEPADGGPWLVEVRAMDEGRDEAGVPGWIPLPWQDWA